MKEKSHYYCLVAIVVLALGSRLFFWLWTNWTIEDAMIVGRVARNFAEGGTLSFHPDERISIATSPIFALSVGILTAAGFSPITAAKLLGLLSGTVTCVLLFKITRYLSFSSLVAAAGTVFYVILPPVVAYSVAGLETAVYTLCIVATFEQFLREQYRQALIMASLSFLVRPDGLIALLVFGGLIFWSYRKEVHRLLPILWPAALILCAGISAHWLYYGEFLPGTVMAKSVAYTVRPAESFAKYTRRMFLSQPEGLPVYALAIAGTVWSVKKDQKFVAMIVWYFLYHTFFILNAPLFSWYLQPPLFVVSMFAGIGMLIIIQHGLSWIGYSEYIVNIQVISGLIVGIIFLAAMVPYGRNRALNQEWEEEVRAAAGKWLAENTSSDELVFTESLGYIGYQTDNPFVDWPGLTDPEIPVLLMQAGTAGSANRMDGYLTIINEYLPQYLVLRENEWEWIDTWLAPDYSLCADFSGSYNQDERWVIACRKSMLRTHRYE